MSDKVLIQQACSGNGAAFELLYQRYAEPIYRYVFFRVRQQREDAEDLVQQVFMNAWQGLKRYRSQRAGFRTWLYRIARNAVIDYYRRSRVHIHLDKVIIATRSDAGEKIFRDHERAELLRAMRHLTKQQRLVVKAKYLEGLSNRDLSDRMNKNVQAIRAIHHRALKNLRGFLSRVS